MTETPSKTANHQRLVEMFVHLTPLGARIPYSISIDSLQNIWVASKGGLFKIDRLGKLLFEEKNDSAKKAEPFCQVLSYENKIIYAYSEYMSGLTLLEIMELDGEMISKQFIDGKIQSLTVNDSGEMFLTKRAKGKDSIIYSSDVCCPSCWSEVICEDDYIFQTVCALSSDLLVVSTCTSPINMYSRQSLRLINVKDGKVIKSFSKEGKEDGEIFFPLSIQKHYLWKGKLSWENKFRFKRKDLNKSHVFESGLLSSVRGKENFLDANEGCLYGTEIFLTLGYCKKTRNSCNIYGSDILVLDKTGRIQQFTQDGEFVRVAVKIDAYLGNAFVVDGDMALLACSGIVLDKDNNSICDDWLEKVPLDGSKWLPDPDFDGKK